MGVWQLLKQFQAKNKNRNQLMKKNLILYERLTSSEDEGLSII